MLWRKENVFQQQDANWPTENFLHQTVLEQHKCEAQELQMHYENPKKNKI